MITQKLFSVVKSIPWAYRIAEFIFMMYSVIANRAIKTITTFPPGHFYSPLPNLKAIRNNSEASFSGKQIPMNINLKTDHQLALLRNFSHYHPDIPFSRQASPTSRYYSQNRYFGDGDATILFCMMRHFKPTRLIEVGSGFSSALILDVNEKFFDNRMKLTFIEPNTDRLLGLLSAVDQEKCTLIEAQVQTVPRHIFESLDENDILFIDSSHVVKVGSDVTHILFKILPSLKTGVIIHFHDILWPFEYPEDWVMRGISWNEAYFLQAFLSFNDSFEILYFNSYIAECFPNELKQSFSSSIKDTGGSLWLRKTM